MADCLHHSGMVASLEAVCRKVEHSERVTNVKLDAIHEALHVAKEEMERRLEGMNEFRAQLSNQAATFISKRETELILEKIETRIKILEDVMIERRGSTKWSDHIITVGIAAGVMLVAHYIFKF